MKIILKLRTCHDSVKTNGRITVTRPKTGIIKYFQKQHRSAHKSKINTGSIAPSLTSENC